MALLLMIAHRALQFAFVVCGSQGLALVVGVLTFTKRDLHLDERVLKI